MAKSPLNCHSHNNRKLASRSHNRNLPHNSNPFNIAACFFTHSIIFLFLSSVFFSLLFSNSVRPTFALFALGGYLCLKKKHLVTFSHGWGPFSFFPLLRFPCVWVGFVRLFRLFFFPLNSCSCSLGVFCGEPVWELYSFIFTSFSVCT